MSEGTQITITSDDVVTVLNAAKELDVHFTTLYRRITAGKIVGIKLGGVMLIPRTEIERLKKENQETKSARQTEIERLEKELARLKNEDEGADVKARAAH